MFSSTAKLRIWTLPIGGVLGSGFRSARQVLCGHASCLFLDHLSKHLSSILGRTELDRSWGPESRAPKTPSHPQRKKNPKQRSCYPQRKSSGNTFSVKVPHNTRSKAFQSDQICSLKRFPSWRGNKAFRMFFWAHYRKGASVPICLEASFIEDVRADAGGPLLVTVHLVGKVRRGSNFGP